MIQIAGLCVLFSPFVSWAVGKGFPLHQYGNRSLSVGSIGDESQLRKKIEVIEATLNRGKNCNHAQFIERNGFKVRVSQQCARRIGKVENPVVPFVSTVTEPMQRVLEML